MSKTTTLLLLVLSAAVLSAQETRPSTRPDEDGDAGAATRPTQDPKALALLKRADEVLYSPRHAGLKDLKYVQRLPVGGDRGAAAFVTAVKWKAPDLKAVEISVEGEGSEKIEAMMPQFEDTLRQQALSQVDMVVGKDNLETYKDDRIELASPNEVKIVAVSPETKKQFSETVVTFDEKGRPTHRKLDTIQGSMEMDVTYEEKEGKWLPSTIETRMSAGGREGSRVVRFSYTEAGGFTFPSKVELDDPIQQPTAMTFGGYEPNTGLTEEDFE